MCESHSYLEKGHTWNAADTVHSVIETKTRPCEIYSPQQWYDKIAVAKRKKTPMKVIKVTQDMIFDWKDLRTKLQLDVNTDKGRIPRQTLRQVGVDGEEDNRFFYRTEFGDSISFVSTMKRGRPVNVKEFTPSKAYSSVLPISKEKYDDLRYYCENKLIPGEFHQFYLNLPNDGMAETSEEVPQVNSRERKRKAKPKHNRNKKKKQGAEEEHSSSEDDNIM